MLDVSIFEYLTTLADAQGVEQCVVGAIVHHEGTVLLLKRTKDDFMGGVWELPSGKVELDEAPDKALIREVKEETGLTVIEISEYLGSFDYQSGSGKKSRQFNFAVDVAAPEPVRLTEHDAYTWTLITDDLPVTDAVKDMLMKFREPRIV